MNCSFLKLIFLALIALFYGCNTYQSCRFPQVETVWEAQIEAIDIGGCSPSNTIKKIQQQMRRTLGDNVATLIFCPEELPINWILPMPKRLPGTTIRAVLENVALGLDRQCVFLGNTALLGGNPQYAFIPFTVAMTFTDIETRKPINSVNIDPKGWLLPPRIHLLAPGRYLITVYIQIRFFEWNAHAFLFNIPNLKKIPVKILAFGYSPEIVHLTFCGDEHSFQDYNVDLYSEKTKTINLEVGK